MAAKQKPSPSNLVPENIILSPTLRKILAAYRAQKLYFSSGNRKTKNRRNYLVLIIAIVILGLIGAIFLLTRGRNVQNTTSPNSNEAPVENIDNSNVTKLEPSPTPQVNVKTISLVIVGDKLEGSSTIAVLTGEEILLKINSDHNDELHINGIEKSAFLQKGVESELSFTPNLTGRFPMVLKSSNVEIGVLEVYPKAD